MITKTYILSEAGKILNRVIKVEDGKEYILHKGMKAFLKTLPEQRHGEFTVVRKQVDYYVNKQ